MNFLYDPGDNGAIDNARKIRIGTTYSDGAYTNYRIPLINIPNSQSIDVKNFYDLTSSLDLSYEPGNNTLTINGTVQAAYFSTLSSRDYKKNIKLFNKSATNIIKNTKIVSYKYKKEYDKIGLTRIGFIAEDTPNELTLNEGKRMDIDNCIGVIFKAIQEINDRLDKAGI